MRITVISWYFPTRSEPYRGHSAYQTLRELAKLAEVNVLCPQERYPKFIGPRSYLHWEPETSFPQSEVPVQYVPFRVFPVLTRPINGYLCANALEKSVRALKPDVLLSYKIYPGGFATVHLARKLGIPSAVVAIGSDLNRIADPFSRHMTRKVMSGADMVFTVSRHLRQQAIRLGAPAERVHAMHNGCDDSIFRPADRLEARKALGIDADAELILYVGRLDTEKGLRELIAAFNRIAPSRPKARLALIGEGPARPILEQAANDGGARERITFVTPQPSRGISQWMAACSVFSLPSYAEGCPNVIMEALHCGRAVVGTNVGGIPELINHEAKGVLVPVRDEAGLAEGLLKALDRNWDPNEIVRLARRNWEDVAREKLDCCAALIEKRVPEQGALACQ